MVWCSFGYLALKLRNRIDLLLSHFSISKSFIVLPSYAAMKNRTTSRDDSRRPLKKQKRTVEHECHDPRGLFERSRLHRLCCNPGDPGAAAFIGAILREHPHAAAESLTVTRMAAAYSPTKRCHEKKIVKEQYSLPLHLAIHHKAGPEILSLLIDAAPSVLLREDGPRKQTPVEVLQSISSAADNDKCCRMLLLASMAAWSLALPHQDGYDGEDDDDLVPFKDASNENNKLSRLLMKKNSHKFCGIRCQP